MIKKLKLSALALLSIAAAVSANADTNLLQTVSVAFTSYTQGTPSTNAHGDVINIVKHYSYGTKNLIDDISASGTNNPGDLLVRATPVTNVTINVTNLSPVSTTNLVITNISTSELIVSNAVLFGGTSNYIGTTNVTFGTNIIVVDGTNVTTGTNTVTVGTNVLAIPVIGTNTTVTTTILINGVGNPVGTNYAFVINALVVTQAGTNKLGTAFWAIYNNHTTPKLTPISTNVYFDIHTDHVYTLTNLAYIHGETIKASGKIQFGTTDEIRTMVLSNSTTQVRLTGYSHGSIVAVSLGTTASAQVVDSQNYHWTGSGSGIVGGTNAMPAVIDGGINEVFFKLKD